MSKPLAVLIVEDSESDAEIVVRLLTKADYAVVSERVETAELMRAALAKRTWDVVISDYAMPQFDGRAALAVLQATGLDLPFIVVSGTMGEETAVAMMRAGAHDYLMKDHLARLAPAIERELAQAKMRGEHKRAEEALRVKQWAIESAASAIAMSDLKGNLNYVNPAFLKLWGYGCLAEVAGKAAVEFWQAGDRATEIIETLRALGSWSGDLVTQRKNGSLFEVSVVASMVLDAAGRPICMQAWFTDITERKQAENRLRESEEKFRGMAVNLSDALFISDSVGVITYMSPAALRIFGWLPEEMVGRPFTDFLPDDQLPIAMTEFQRVLSTNDRTIDIQLLMKHKSGTLFHGELSSSILKEGETVLGTLGQIRDVTKRMQEQAALRESEQTVSAIVESSQDWIWAIDRNCRHTYTNRAVESILGYSPAEFQDLGLDLVHPDDKPLVAAEWPGWVEERRGWRNRVLRWRAKDGAYRHLESTAMPILDPRGELLGFRGVDRDITERKRVEKALQESEQRFMSVLYASSDAILLIDGEKFVDCNEATARMLGYLDRNAFLKTHPSELSPPTQPDGKNSFEKAEEMMNEAFKRGFHQFEWEHRKANGEDFPVEVSLTSIMLNGKNVLHCVWRDISERKRSEAARKRADLGLKERNRQLAELNVFAMELASLPTQLGVEECAVKRLNQMAGTAAAWFSEYDSDQRALVMRCFEAESGLLGKITKLLRVPLTSVRSPVSDENHRAIIGEVVGKRRTLTEMSFGAIPLPVGLAVQKLLGADRFIGLAHVIDGELWGTSVLAMKSDHPDPPTELLESFAHLLAVSLRRRHAEEALRESKQFLASTLDGLSSHIAVIDASGELILTNKAYRAFAEQNGIHPRAVSEGTNYLAVCDAARGEWSEEAAPFGEGIRQVLHGSRPSFEVEYPCHSPDEMRWFIGRVTPLDGDGPRRVVVSHVNITERKRMEDERRTAAERLDRLLSSLYAGVLAVSEDGTVEHVNQAFCDLFNLSAAPASYCGLTSTKMLKHIMDRYASPAETLARVETITSQGKPIKGEEVVLKDGRVLLVDFVPINVHGKKCGRIWHHQNITEQKKAEAEREQLAEQLRMSQKMESVGRLAGGVAHDFNNQLQVIFGYTTFAQKHVDPREPLYADLEEIRKAAQRSADLTRQLLAFARKQTIAPEVVDLNVTIESILKMLRRLIGEAIDLAWMPGANLWPIKADPAQIDQMLANLCVNARDAIGGVGKVTIETRTARFDEVTSAGHVGCVPGEYVMLRVGDDGCGMDKETLDRIFEPFFTTKGLGEGTGLGLAMVHGIVTQNNGFIDVQSELGEGTTFRIYLPRHEGEAADVLKERVEELPRGQGETVLVVEDEVSILRLARRMLEGLGYVVLTAGTPDEAIRLAEEHTGEIHLLVTDVVMPQMMGKDLAERIIGTRPGLRGLYMSGYTADVIAPFGVLEAGVRFMQKPFALQDLAVKVREVLEG